MNPRLRAGLVIGAVAVASAIAGAAIDRALVVRNRPQGRGGSRGGPPSASEEAGRRAGMLDKMTKELSLTSAQRAGLDSIFQRTDSSLRSIRRATQPQIQQVFEQSRRDIDARLDSTQRAKFAAMHARGAREFRGGRGGRGFGGRGADSGRQ